jgi:hypothetical protein
MQRTPTMCGAYLFWNCTMKLVGMLWNTNIPSTPNKTNPLAIFFPQVHLQFFVFNKLNVSWNQMSQPHFEASVTMRLALPKVGTWSPPWLSKLQNSIVGVKTPFLEMLFILLERSWSVDVENGFAWVIRTFIAQAMVKRRDGSQTGNLTPDH